MTNRLFRSRLSLAKSRQGPKKPLSVDIVKDEVAQIDDLIRTSKGVWLGMLAYLAYIGVTLLGVEDAHLFLVERQTDLPLIGVSIPTSLFFVVSPALAAMLFTYMHLYLLKLWDAIFAAPAKVNGLPLSATIAPWVVADFALSFRKDGALKVHPLQFLSTTATIVFVFLASPVVLTMFLWSSSVKHDVVLTFVWCGLPLMLSIYASFSSLRRIFRLSLGNATSPFLHWKELLGLCAVSSVLAYLTGFVSAGTIGDYVKGANLENVAFVQTPPDWLHRDEAQKAFRKEWCSEKGISALACGISSIGSVERETETNRLNDSLAFHREAWCKLIMGNGVTRRDCLTEFLNLDYAYAFDWTRMRRAELDSLPKRDMSKFDLRRANLSFARMEALDLRGVRMEKAILLGSQLEGADLSGVRLDGAHLYFSWLQDAYLNGAKLTGADLSYARMENADLSEALLERAELRKTRMDSYTDLTNTTFSLAGVAEVDFSDVSISMAQINSMFGDASVTLPNNITPSHPDWPAHWPKFELSAVTFQTEWRKWQANPSTYTPPTNP